MKTLIILLFVALCLFSIHFAPRIIYGTFGMMNHKEAEKVGTSKHEVTYEEAKTFSPSWAYDKKLKYEKYVTYRDKWSTKHPFWLSKVRDTIEQGYNKKSFEE